ncbi:MAG: DUF1015 family protein, partial [Candidatus Stygibacter frigidus]|nr:DUF1015 family protein [Candidatus Stygibacter frigidus]
PSPEYFGKVVSPPYDVLNSEEARQQVKGKPYSFLHVVKPEVDLPADLDIYDEKVYQKGRENLYNMIKNEIMIQDDKPSYYLYQLIMGRVNQIGLVAVASVEDYENNIIKKHEHTRAVKEADRIKHVDALNANTGPVFLTYPPRTDMNDLVSKLIQNTPLYDYETEDKINHIIWKIDQEEIVNKITAIFADIKYLYVADGHHRSASATKVGQQRRAANPDHTGEEEYNYFLSVIFPANQLYIMDYNRIVNDLNGLSESEFLAKVEKNFVVEKQMTEYNPEGQHHFGMYIGGAWYKLTARHGSFPEADPVLSLDVSILQNNLLSPILGIGDPRHDKRIDFVGGIRGLKELSNRVDAGEAVAFSVFPTSIKQLMEIADAGEVMPPKSTWFEPKLRSGVVVHLLD